MQFSMLHRNGQTQAAVLQDEHSRYGAASFNLVVTMLLMTRFVDCTCAGEHQIPQARPQRRLPCKLPVAGEVLLHRRRRRQHLEKRNPNAI